MDIVSYVRARLAPFSPVSIGSTPRGNEILCAHVGDYGGPQSIVTAAIHARECYTALVALAQADYAAAHEPSCGGVYFIPLVNPDGAQFFESGYRGESERTALRRFGKSPVLSRHVSDRLVWKANADGVDLNVNFDARYGCGAQNTREIGPANYIGAHAFCAAESRALARFTSAVMPRFTVSYHSMGGELYWEFGQTGAARARDERIAAAIAEHIGVKKVDGDLGSAGGYKDYCISRLGITSVTAELVDVGAHPLGPQAYERDIQKNLDLPLFLKNLF